ncbi:MAG: DUF4292 domain-containing protein [Ekhidna sp.]
MNKLISALLIGMLFLTSCNRKIGDLFSKKDKLEIVNPEFEYLSAKAKFKFDHDGKKVSASANFRVQKDSIIWISISSLGFEGARVLVNTENIYILDKLKRQYYEYSFDGLSKQLDFDLDFKLIQSVVLGNLVDPYDNQKIEKMENYYSFMSEKGVYFFQNFIGTRTMKLEKMNISEADTKNTISVNYSDFSFVDKQVFPSEIQAVIDYEDLSKSNTEINISYNKMVIADGPIRFPYSVPSKYERK